MLFNSFGFLVFFPVITVVYYFIPNRYRYIWLLLASYFFYMQWNAIYVLLLLFSTVIAYGAGIVIDGLRDRKPIVKVVFVVTLLLSFFPLFYFKYVGFIADNLNRVFRIVHIDEIIGKPDVLLPVGISFFTFQAVGYIIDVYRQDVKPEKNPLRFALFISFFPQLVAGPIERSRNLLSQFKCEVKFDYDRARDGFWLMLWGYFLKIVLADRIAIFVDFVYSQYTDFGGAYLIIASVLFAFQIYCDFAGYSTIAIGAAKILGIKLMKNFDAPYLNESVTGFWRDWHISLTTWFRDYVYIPLGGNRKGNLRKQINKMVVFLLSGLWHGANWSFVIWGGWNGLWQIIEDVLNPISEKLRSLLGNDNELIPNRIIKGLFTFIVVDFGWIFFRANSFKGALSIIKSIGLTSNWNIILDGSIYNCGLDVKNFRLMVLMIGVLLFVDYLGKQGIVVREVISRQNLWCRIMITAVAINFILLFGIWGTSYSAGSFIYFQF